MLVSTILFAAAAIGGLIMAIQRLRGGNPRAAIAVIHGLAAAAALVVLLIAIIGSTTGAGVVSLALLGGAALGGFVLASFHLRGRKLPVPLMLIHALVAVAGFVLLLVALF